MRRNRVLALILVILSLPTATAWAQQVVYGCVKNNNGQLRIVNAGDACLPSEHAIQWTAGTTASAPPPPGQLRVVDQNGATVGLLISQNTAARQAGEVWLSLPVAPGGFQVTDPMFFTAFYQAPDCSGDAYLPVDSTNLLRTGTVMAGPSGLAVTYAGKPEVDRTTIQGYAHTVGGTWTCTPYTPGAWMPLFGKAGTLDVSTFQGPFRVAQ